MTTVRVASDADVPRLVEMGCAFLQSSPYRATYAENPDQMATLARQVIGSPDGAFFVAERAGALVGMLGLIVYAHFISGQRVAGEVVYWVQPEARGLGVRLLRTAERWAKARGASVLQMISPDPRVDALYARLGYKPIERTFQRVL